MKNKLILILVLTVLMAFLYFNFDLSSAIAGGVAFLYMYFGQIPTWFKFKKMEIK